jgi:hypothetical protein
VAEKQYGRTIEEAEKAWSEARRSVEGTEEEVAKIWQWGLLSEGCGRKRLAKYEVSEMKKRKKDLRLKVTSRLY